MNIKGRLLLSCLFFLLLFGINFLQFYKVQILQGAKWGLLAKRQQERFITEPCKRGRIMLESSLKGKHPPVEFPLVFDVLKYHLYVNPSAIDPSLRPPLVRKLMFFLSLTDQEEGHFYRHLETRSKSRLLKRWISLEKKEEIEKWWFGFAKRNGLVRNGLYFIKEYQRCYPGGSLLGVLLHTVRDDRDPKTFLHLPTGGLELKYDRYLRGTPGKKALYCSLRQSFEGEGTLVPAEDGSDLYLTVDPYIQMIAEEEIARGIHLAKAKGGWAIVMNPHTGEIYALAQYPPFYPFDYRTSFNDPKLKEFTYLKAVSDCFEPGSSMKPISMAIALLANQEMEKRGQPAIFDPNQMVPTTNGFLPGRKKPLRDVAHSRYLNMALALKRSSNIYVAQLMHRVGTVLGYEWYYEQLSHLFQFGKKVELGLPAESSGLLPRPFSPDRKRSRWSLLTLQSLSFGYNILVNSIQLMRAWATLVNGGYRVSPHIIKRIVRKKMGRYDEEVILSPPKQRRERVLSPEISASLVEALRMPTQPGGTALRGNVPGYTEGGKTSTTEKLVKGQYSHTLHIASFIGFSPLYCPKFLVLVVIDEPSHQILPGVGALYFGGRCAAPVFSHIVRRACEYLGTTPDDPYGRFPGDPRSDYRKIEGVEKVREWNALYRQWNQ